MIPDTRSLIRSVLAGCIVDPPRGFEWFGRWVPTAGFAAAPNLPQESFSRTLSLHLYFHVFCPGKVIVDLPPTRACSAGEVRALLMAHSFANPDRERWDTGWSYVGRSRDSHLVRSSKGIDFSVSETGIRPRRGDALRVGSNVEVLIPADRWSLSPGFMLFSGERPLHPRSAGIRRTRLYLDLDVEDARRVIGLCRRFNEARIPFTLKVAGHPDAYDRCDTVILFVGRDDYRRASELLIEEAAGSGITPRPPVPAFTRRLASGIAVADDPHVAESFGETRCRLLAAGILRAHDAGDSVLESRLREIERTFLAEGVSLDSAHLEPGSAEYEIDPWSRWPVAS